MLQASVMTRGRKLFLWALELLRFGGVGLSTAALYFVLLWLLGLAARLPAWLAGALAYGPCLVANYLMHRWFTFRSVKEHGQAGPRYLAVQIGGMLINSGVLWLGVDVLRLSYWPSQIAAIACLGLWSYLGQRFWAFS